MRSDTATGLCACASMYAVLNNVFAMWWQSRGKYLELCIAWYIYDDYQYLSI